MREIRFRTYDKQAKKMVIVCTLLDGEYFQISTGHILKDNLMQFTGLKDKNGVDIYEGDVLRCESENYIGGVSFKSGCFTTDCEGWGEVCMSGVNLEDVEIIGNIHENPELLK